jgi:hypothetical protein
MELTCVRHVVEVDERERELSSRTQDTSRSYPEAPEHLSPPQIKSAAKAQPRVSLLRRVVMKIAEVPYAADAEVSLTYDELQVRPCHSSQHVLTESIYHLCVGSPHPVRKGGSPNPRHNPNEIQLCVGSCKEPSP